MYNYPPTDPCLCYSRYFPYKFSFVFQGYVNRIEKDKLYCKEYTNLYSSSGLTKEVHEKSDRIYAQCIQSFYHRLMYNE